MRRRISITLAAVLGSAFSFGVAWDTAPDGGVLRVSLGAYEAAAQVGSEEGAAYLAQVQNAMSRFRGEMARMERAAGIPDANYTAAQQDFGDKEQALRKAVAEMKAGGPNAFYQHKPAVDAALAAFEGAYQRVQQAVP